MVILLSIVAMILAMAVGLSLEESGHPRMASARRDWLNNSDPDQSKPEKPYAA